MLNVQNKCCPVLIGPYLWCGRLHSIKVNIQPNYKWCNLEGASQNPYIFFNSSLQGQCLEKSLSLGTSLPRSAFNPHSKVILNFKLLFYEGVCHEIFYRYFLHDSSHLGPWYTFNHNVRNFWLRCAWHRGVKIVGLVNPLLFTFYSVRPWKMSLSTKGFYLIVPLIKSNQRPTKFSILTPR